MDSVLSAGISIRKDAERAGDSLSMAKSLLPVRGEVSMADQQSIVPYLPGAASTFRNDRLYYEEAVINGLIAATKTRTGIFACPMVQLDHRRDQPETLDIIVRI